MCGRDAAGGGLITCACAFAAKKWPIWPSRPNRRNWTSRLKNGPDRPHGKSDFPVEPTRTDRRSGRRRAGSGVTVQRGRRRGSGSAAGQSRCPRVAPRRPGYAGGRLPGPTCGSGAANPSKSVCERSAVPAIPLARDRCRLRRPLTARPPFGRGPEILPDFHCDTPERSCAISACLGTVKPGRYVAGALIFRKRSP